MRLAIALLLSAGFMAAPAPAQVANNSAANAMTAPANAQQPVLPVTNEAATAPAAPESAPAYPPASAPRHGFPWGILGLIGLVGLLGRARR